MDLSQIQSVSPFQSTVSQPPDAFMRFLFPVLIATMLIACGRGDDTPHEANAPPPHENTPDTSISKPVTKARKLSEPLPESVSPTFPYHVRYERTVPRKRRPGVYQYRVLFEFLDGDVQSTANRITEDMTAAGFRAGEPEKREDGGLSIRFDKDGYGRVIATVRPTARQNLRHVQAKGTIRLDFPAEAPAGEPNSQ